jgi:hypothetical protein
VVWFWVSPRVESTGADNIAPGGRMFSKMGERI